jgi:HAE1 family hydrophobic/amphiphilic exporter-1
VKLEVIRDQSRYIYAALHEIDLHLVLGSILACLVVLAFMRSWRATLIAAIAIPTSVIATFGVMKALDFTLNGVTMLALVLMVGVVIDDAIVVLENIFRFVEEKGMPPIRRGEGGDRGDRAGGAGDDAEPRRDLRAGVVHVEHLGPLPLPVRHHRRGPAVLVSLLVSFTLTPMMSARLLRRSTTPRHERVRARSRGGFYAWHRTRRTWQPCASRCAAASSCWRSSSE